MLQDEQDMLLDKHIVCRTRRKGLGTIITGCRTGGKGCRASKIGCRMSRIG